MTLPLAGSIRICSEARKGIPRMTSLSCRGATMSSAGLLLSQSCSGTRTLLTTFLLTSTPWGFMGSWMRKGGVGWVGIACSSTLSADIKSIVAPLSTREEDISVFLIMVTILIVGTEGREYSESESDSTTEASRALTDSFLASFFFSASILSGQSLDMWPALILRHQ